VALGVPGRQTLEVRRGPKAWSERWSSDRLQHGEGLLVRYLDEAESFEELIFQALGAASACWNNLEGAGVFESDRCKAIGDELIERLQAMGTVAITMGVRS